MPNQTKISIVETLNGNKTEKDINEIEKELKENYDEEDKSGLCYYEYFNMLVNEFKPHFDIEKYVTKEEYDEFDEDKFLKPIYEVFNNLFKTKNKDYAVDEDNRKVKKDGKWIYKISYHFILHNKKTNLQTIREYSKIINAELKPYDIKIDTSIYRKGMTKFRLPFAKKDKDKWSLLKPKTHKNKFGLHVIQLIDGIIENLEIEKQKLKDMKLVIKMNTSTKDIINGFKIKSKKKMDNGSTCYSIELDECPFVNRPHSNNHNYLIDKGDKVFLRCHSKKCEGKFKVIFNKNSCDDEFVNFSIKKFNSFKLKGNSNYNERKAYFERYYVFLGDSGKFCRVKYEKRKGYYEKSLKVVSRPSRLKYQMLVKNKEGEEEIKNLDFISAYMEDQNIKEYYEVAFIPKKENEVNGVYNLFDGYKFEDILDEGEEITREDLDDLDFFINFIKNNVCDGNDNFFDYFISHFATIIQRPEYLTHMILILFSIKGGTGKSNFLKFFSKVIGEVLSFFGSVSELLEKHSTAHVGNLINIVEEVDYKGFVNNYETFKNFSQRERGTYNEKGLPVQQINTFVRYFMTTNNRLKIPKMDRRFFVFEFKKLERDEDILRIDRIYENKKMIYLFGDYLMNYKLKIKSRKEWIENKPSTPAYNSFVREDSFVAFLSALFKLDRNYFSWQHRDKYKNYLMKRYPDTMKIKKTDLFSIYNSFMDKYGGTAIKSKSNFHSKISNEYEWIKMTTTSGIEYYKINLRTLNSKMKIVDEYKNYINEEYIDEELEEEAEDDEEIEDDEESEY